MTILSIVLLIAGIFFLIVSNIGIIRLPDFYCRIHAVGKSETLGAILVLGGLAAYNGFEINSFKLLVILVFIAMANPTATNAIARAAVRSGLQPWVRIKEKEALRRPFRRKPKSVTKQVS